MFRKLLLSVAAAAALAFGAPVQAAPTTGLYLTMDGSGSISDADFTLQISSYHAALDAFFVAHPTAFGQVAIGGGIFGGNFSEFFAPQEITDQTVLDALTAAIDALDPGRGGIDTGSTAIGDAITASQNSLIAALGLGPKLVIDVTTDGQNNSGSDPATAAANAILAGIDAVNCLGIGPAADCSFVAGSGTDFGQVNFADLEAALNRKIATEVVPEPASLALLGTALAGLGFMRRRRRNA